MMNFNPSQSELRLIILPSDVSDGQKRLWRSGRISLWITCVCFRVLSVQTGPLVSRVSRVLLVSEGTTEPLDVRGRGDRQALRAAQGTRVTPERMVQG